MRESITQQISQIFLSILSFTLLDTENVEEASLKPLLVPYPADRMQMYPVSTEVNNARHECEELVRRISL